MKRWCALIALLSAFLLPGASGKIRLDNIRYYSYPEYTRVVLDLSAPVRVRERILRSEGGGRLFFDLSGAVFGPAYPADRQKEIGIESGNLRRIRLGKGDGKGIRVVFDFDRIGKYQMFYLTEPFRVVFDINRGDNGAARKPAVTAGAETSVPAAGGQPSLARQLGLGVHRIIIDPGHGGKDPGTVNRQLKLQEKDIVLDVAKQLKVMLSEHPEFEIVMTRERDEFISLEERTAIANSRRGDLFLSIHTNSAPRLTARGVESYFLSITADPWAMSVAAQENAMSSKSIGEMKSILDRIVRSANITESRNFTASLQSGLVGHLREKYDQIDSLGVKKAPFYVLVGAQMPASLVEVSFLSSAPEGERLGSAAYRRTIAAGLYFGVLRYIKALGKS